MCQHCKINNKLKPSKRIHKRPPRKFFDCSCGRTVEGVEHKRADGSIYVREVKARAVEKPSVSKSTRLYVWEEEERLKTGETVRAYIERKAIEKALA